MQLSASILEICARAAYFALEKEKRGEAQSIIISHPQLAQNLPLSSLDPAATTQHSEGDDTLCSRDEFGKEGA